MIKSWKIVGIVALVVILGTAATAALVLAQDAPSGSGPFDFGQRLREAVAEALGITVEKYDAAVETAQKQVVEDAVAEGWLTQDQADEMGQRMELDPGLQGLGPGFGPGRRGMGSHMGVRIGRQEDSLIEVAADKLGMTTEELMTELRDGKSIADVAKEKGVDTQVISDAYLAKLMEKLDKAVTDGQITQKMADWMLEQAKQNLPDQLSSTGLRGMPGGPRGGNRPGWTGESPVKPETSEPTAAPAEGGI